MGLKVEESPLDGDAPEVAKNKGEANRCPAGRRRQITDEEVSKLKNHDRVGGIYIGRGGRGLPPSKWGNPIQGRPGRRPPEGN